VIVFGEKFYSTLNEDDEEFFSEDDHEQQSFGMEL
jgi:hypothetical protein